ncbi:hypothetical protein EJ110_NYTH39182 [Nymphaea thermarum]|nr:hypothetical protein EJ110_NYTH39182 [Nymphaea thermarum]
MADSSSSSTVNTDQPDVGTVRTDNVLVQVTTIWLTKENYLRWSAAITMGIAGRGRIAYVNGRKVEPAVDSMAWDTWFLEDNQVKTWIVNSVSSDIQTPILRKKTARDMWIILEQMYGQKKRKVCVYQLMKEVYALRQGDLSVADFYAALKSKWEDLDYHSDVTWSCPQDQMQYMAKEWENRIRQLRAYLSQIDVGQADTSDEAKVNQALAISGEQDNKKLARVVRRRFSEDSAAVLGPQAFFRRLTVPGTVNAVPEAYPTSYRYRYRYQYHTGTDRVGREPARDQKGTCHDV